MFVTIKARVYTDSSGVYNEIPALLTPCGVLTPLLDYCLSHDHDRSLNWMSKVNRSVCLFLDFLQSNPNERDTYRLFQNFAQRLYTGTCARETGLDPSGLCWAPRSGHDSAHIITHLTDFFDWLSEIRPTTAMLNPRYTGGYYDRMADEAAYQYRRDSAFLGHTWAVNASTNVPGHRTRAQNLPKFNNSEPPAFPDEHFMDLLWKGFKVGDTYDYRNMLITLLLHGAGFRESEPFHLYIGDVQADPTSPQQALVRIHHPTHGIAPSDWLDARGKPRKGNRATYLAEKFHLVPRTKRLDRRGAGWKGGMHDGRYYKQAYWFPPEFGEIFLTIWHRYLKDVALIDRDHPFAFINLRRAPLGEQYSLAQFLKAHQRACGRIGLSVSKALGTTPHGHRHSYGRRLKNAGVDKMLIRRFMHHASIESQEVYTQATTKEAISALEEAAIRLRASTNFQSVTPPSCPSPPVDWDT